MRVLFINPAPQFYSGTASASAPLGLLSIATYLNRNGHVAAIYDRTIRHVSLEKQLERFSPEIVGISLFSIKSVADSLAIASACRRRGLPVVWGGQMASMLIDTVLDTGEADYISVGEGEGTWLELLDTISAGGDIHSVAGLAFRENGKTVRTKQREFMDLSTLPTIDWTLLDDVDIYFQATFCCKKMMYICSSRGCFGNCTFCINEPFNRCAYRRRPVRDVMDEIEYLEKNHGLDGVYFAAELFCKNKNEVYELLEERKNRGLTFVWGCQTRIGIFSEEDFQFMYDNGCRWMFFGVESGSPEILRSVRKNINLELVPPTFEACAGAGITTIASFIIGLVDETEDDLRKTVSLALSLKNAMYSFNCLAPCPGSQMLADVVKYRNFVPPERLIDYTKVKYIDRPEPNFSRLPDKDITVVRDWFQWQSFTAPSHGKEKNDRLFAVKVLADTLRTAVSNGPVGFVRYGISAAVKGASTFANAYFHPGIRKKYGLYKKRD